MKAKEFIPQSKPRNFVVKNQKTAGAGAHKDKKRAEKQGDVKHKQKQFDEEAAGVGIVTKQNATADVPVGGEYMNVKKLFPKKKKVKEQGVAEGGIATVGWPDDGNHTGNNPPVRIGGTFPARPVVKKGSLVKARGLNGVYRVMDIRGDQAYIVQEIPNSGGSTYIPMSDLRVWTNKPITPLRNDSMSERVRDPEDWDEGNTEPGNNFAVYINGKKWKVLPGPAGAYADSPEERREFQRLKDMAARKSAATGKKWEVYITGEPATK
jgi:hypothetical protein